MDCSTFASPSSRRAWIEILSASSPTAKCAGSPSSRRAWIEIQRDIRPAGLGRVALLAEGVDRNYCSSQWVRLSHEVALLAEGVDSNWPWPIESVVHCVALLAEGVDRNRLTVFFVVASVQSPSSRRAWIEIRAAEASATVSYVALLAEGVDRNGRSPAAWYRLA